MPEADQLESLLDQLLAGLTEVMQSGETLSDEFQGMIAQELATTLEKINELRNGAPPTPDNVKINNVTPTDETRLIWILSGSDPQTFISYLQTYPGDEFQQLLRNPEQLQQVIRGLQENPSLQPIEGAAQDGIPKADLQSSNIYGTQYDPQTKKLLVRFQEGGVYEYDQVPPYVFKAFQSGASSAKTKGQNRFGEWWVGKNPSLGAAFWNYIRNAGYSYRKLK